MYFNKLRRSVLLTVFAAVSIAMAACDKAPEVKQPASVNPGSSPATSASPSSSPLTSPNASPATSPGANKVDGLVGQWGGPEATHLNVTKKGDKYTVEIRNLDGTKTFEGTAKGDVIEFTRNGKIETVQAATGAETGMKGFEKETNCVVVANGTEGFCKK